MSDRTPQPPIPPTPPTAVPPAVPAIESQNQRVEKEMKRLTRRSFATGGAAGLLGFGSFAWLKWLAFDKQIDATIPWPLRRVFEFNERIAEKVFGSSRLAREFAVDAAAEPRPNGKVGLAKPVVETDWRLKVSVPNRKELQFSMDDIRAFPKVEMVTELNCVEGWSQVVHWAGTRLSNFLIAHNLGVRSGGKWEIDTARNDLFRYLQFTTPDKKYFVGLDMESALHPQTLLCYEMNGQPLTPAHGAPLRLVITVKYGIKNIKRIGHLRLSGERPADYWAERGYDWYAGL